MGIKKLFIVGVGRSGTTLLQSMLNAHPEICFTPETHFVKRYLVPHLSGNKCFSKANLIQSLAEDKYFLRLDVPLNDVIEKLDTELTNKDLIEVFDTMLARYAQSNNKLFVGDKDPMNSSYIEQIKYAFPDSFLLHIIRDPRDVILSRMKSDWGKNTSFAVHLAEHKVQLESMLKNSSQLFKEKYIEVFYETLLENPEKELQNICDKIGLQYSSEMLDFQKKAGEIVFSDERTWKENVFKPLIKDNKNKWKEGLTQFQVGLVELALKNQFLKLGYNLQTRPSVFSHFYLFFVSLISVVFKMKKQKESIR